MKKTVSDQNIQINELIKVVENLQAQMDTQVETISNQKRIIEELQIEDKKIKMSYQKLHEKNNKLEENESHLKLIEHENSELKEKIKSIKKELEIGKKIKKSRFQFLE